MRQEKSVPLLKHFCQWLQRHKLSTLPKSAIGKAIAYALNNWNALNICVTKPELTIDNNCSERALRAIAVGRKNWLFAGSADGGRTAAIISSLLSTCKQQNLNLQEYLCDVLTKLSHGETDLDQLLPGTWAPAIV